MENQNKIKEMLLLQQQLNDETNGLGWENGVTKDGKIITWRRCIYMECAELIDSFAWKHWKNINTPIDTDNVRIELVDIWHFVMSLFLESHHGQMSFDELAHEIAASTLFSAFCKEAYDINSYNQYELMNDIEIIISETSKNCVNFESLLKNYFALCLKCGVNLSVLFRVYMGKNVLNKFRQEHGYKDGSYKKLWGKKEDNEVLNELLNSGILSPDGLYSELEKIYKDL